MRYFKPRTDLDYSCCLLPQKTDGKKQWKFKKDATYAIERQWVENIGRVDMEALTQNFIEVKTEEEAIS